MVSFHVLPWLFQYPRCSFFWTISSCLMTSVLESLSGSSPFFGNVGINPLQHPLIKLFFSCPSQIGILSRSRGGDFRHLCHASLLLYLPPTWKNEALVWKPLGVIPSWKPFDLSVHFVMALNSWECKHHMCPHPPGSVPLEGANADPNVLIEGFLLPQLLRWDTHSKCQRKSWVR